MARVGYYMSDKKSKKLSFDEFPLFCRNVGIELIKLDLDSPLEDQGPFDLIFHKLTDELSRANQGNAKARKQIQRFHMYTKQYPDITILDPLESLYKLLDRHEQYQHVQNSHTFQHNSQFFTPAFVEFTSSDVEANKRSMEESGVQYPFVCKPSIAHGSSFCHKMAIIFNEQGLRDVQPPCVAQTFINHNALLYKLFIIGQQFFIVERPSIKNFSAGDHQTIFFDSHDVSKADSASFLNEMDQERQPHNYTLRADPNLLRQLAYSVQERFNLALFGIDVIIENVTGRYAVIDINSFPGYDGIPDLFQSLADMIWYHLEKQKRSKEETDSSGTDSQSDTFQQQQQQQQQQKQQHEDNEADVDCLTIGVKPGERSDIRDIVRKQEGMRFLDLDHFPHMVRTSPKEINATLWWEEELARKADAKDREQRENSNLTEDDSTDSLCKRIEDLLENTSDTAKK